MLKFVSTAALTLALAASPAFAQDKPAAPETPQAFVEAAEAAYNKALIEGAQADWVYATYINQDTEALTARAGAKLTELQVSNALQAAKFATAKGLDYDTARKLDRMRTLIVLPAPTRPGAAEELATIGARVTAFE